jgi:hypothetical protein
VEHRRVDNDVSNQRSGEHHGSVESPTGKEQRNGATNLQDSEDITKPLPETSLSEEIHHFSNSDEFGNPRENKKAAHQHLQNPHYDSQTSARRRRDHTQFSLRGYPRATIPTGYLASAISSASCWFAPPAFASIRAFQKLSIRLSMILSNVPFFEPRN